MALWHAGRSAKASTAGPAQRRYALTACSRRGVPDAIDENKWVGALLARHVAPSMQSSPNSGALEECSECLGTSSSAEYHSWLGCWSGYVCLCDAVYWFTGCYCCCAGSGQPRGLTPVSKLQERRVGADGDGIASSAASHAIIDDARKRGQTEPARLSVRPWTPEDLLNAELRSRSSCPCATSSGAPARGGTRALG